METVPAKRRQILSGRLAGFVLFQDADDLGVAEPGFFAMVSFEADGLRILHLFLGHFSRCTSVPNPIRNKELA